MQGWHRWCWLLVDSARRPPPFAGLNIDARRVRGHVAQPAIKWELGATLASRLRHAQLRSGITIHVLRTRALTLAGQLSGVGMEGILQHHKIHQAFHSQLASASTSTIEKGKSESLAPQCARL